MSFLGAISKVFEYALQCEVMFLLANRVEVSKSNVDHARGKSYTAICNMIEKNTF